MEIGELLRRQSNGGKKPVKHIAFEGERFDVMGLRRWRDRVLTTSSGSISCRENQSSRPVWLSRPPFGRDLVSANPVEDITVEGEWVTQA